MHSRWNNDMISAKVVFFADDQNTPGPEFLPPCDCGTQDAITNICG